jgi:hypothetical protein
MDMPAMLAMTIESQELLAAGITILGATGGALAAFGRWLAGFVGKVQQDGIEARAQFAQALKEIGEAHKAAVAEIVARCREDKEVLVNALERARGEGK